MDKAEIIKEIEKRAAAALMAREEAEKHGGPCETYLMQGRWLALQDLLEDIKRRD